MSDSPFPDMTNVPSRQRSPESLEALALQAFELAAREKVLSGGFLDDTARERGLAVCVSAHP